MELVKNIFFNTDKLIEKSSVKISYTGDFFQNNASEVFIHYGFGLNWNDTNEIKMTKTELGYQAEIDLTEEETLNFCFKDAQGNWDNNDSQNYIFPIEKAEVALIVLDNNALSTKSNLKKSYILSKKIKLAIYKLVRFFPKLVSGNYKRKLTNIEEA